MSSVKRYLLAGLLGLFCLRPSAGEYIEPITLSPDVTTPLRGHAMRLADAASAFTIDDVERQENWQPLRRQLNEGFTSAAIWLRFDLIQARNLNHNWRLKIGNPLLDDIRLYRRDVNGKWIEEKAEYRLPNSTWPITARTPTFALALPEGRHTFYLRLSALHSLATLASIQSADRYNAEATGEAMLFGAYFGVFVTLILIQLYMWLRASENLGGWYLPYSIILLFSSMLVAGVARQIFPWSSALLHEVTALLLTLAPIVVANLSATLLDLKHHAPSLRKIFLWTTIVLSLLNAIIVAVAGYQFGVQAQQYLLLVTVFFSTGLGLYFAIHGDRHALFYLLAFSVVDGAVAIRYLRNLGVIPPGFITENILYFAIGAHIIAITAIFIYRFNAIRHTLKIEQDARSEQLDFVEMVSHEFRTPLAVVKTSTEQLSANLDAAIDRRQQRYKNILDATNRLTNLLDEYFSVERFDTANRALHCRTIDPYEILEEAAADFSVDRVRLMTQDIPDHFICDRDLLRVAFRNLIANADRHSPADKPVELRTRGDTDGSLHIEVRDHGEGIPADELTRLFQKYFRGRSAKDKPGAGLGLYLVRKIVAAHGGTVHVESTPGSGTVFRLWVPSGKLPKAQRA